MQNFMCHKLKPRVDVIKKITYPTSHYFLPAWYRSDVKLNACQYGFRFSFTPVRVESKVIIRYPIFEKWYTRITNKNKKVVKFSLDPRNTYYT